jgi:hypothetical protein
MCPSKRAHPIVIDPVLLIANCTGLGSCSFGYEPPAARFRQQKRRANDNGVVLG